MIGKYLGFTSKYDRYGKTNFIKCLSIHMTTPPLIYHVFIIQANLVKFSKIQIFFLKSVTYIYREFSFSSVVYYLFALEN